MVRHGLLLLTCAAFVGCASGARPIAQLNTNETMVGGTMNGPGVEFDPELTAWVRYAPHTNVDLTLGGTITVPLFENAAWGGLAEVRAHIPTSGYMRIVIDVAAEILRYKITQRTSAWVQRFTFAPLLAYDAAEITPYIGPKLMYLSHFEFRDSGPNDGPGLYGSGDGVMFLGGIVGIEDDLDGWVIGGTADLGVLMNAKDVNELESVGGTIAFYIGY